MLIHIGLTFNNSDFGFHTEVEITNLAIEKIKGNEEKIKDLCKPAIADACQRWKMEAKNINSCLIYYHQFDDLNNVKEIEIYSFGDVALQKNKRPHQITLTPKPYQKRIVDFLQSQRSAVISVHMGLGKTLAVLLYLEKAKPKTVVIIAPKFVAETVWLQEAEKWNLQLQHKMIICSGTKKQRFEALQDSKNPYKIVTRDNLSDIEGWTFDIIVIDELTSFKNSQSKRLQYLNSIKSFQKIGLTGTIMANGAIDLWGQMRAVGLMRERENHFYAWRGRYFYDVMKRSKQAFSKYAIRKDYTLEDVIKPFRNNLFTLTNDDYIQMPEVEIIEHSVRLHEKEYEQYLRMSSMLMVELDGITYDIKERAKFFKLQTLCNGFIYLQNNKTNDQNDKTNDQNDEVARSEYHTKIKEVVNFVERAVNEGEQVLLFYAFVEEAQMLSEMLTKAGIKIDSAKSKNWFKRWKNFDINVLLAHPLSIGFGLNLQEECRLVVWSSVTWSMEQYLQANARVIRQGQKYPVQIHTFTAFDTVEERILKAMASKINEQKLFEKITTGME